MSEISPTGAAICSSARAFSIILFILSSDLGCSDKQEHAFGTCHVSLLPKLTSVVDWGDGGHSQSGHIMSYPWTLEATGLQVTLHRCAYPNPNKKLHF
eukprot:c20982_g1_i2 orf=56-349(+)